jgi:hypothetical protein
LSRLPIVIAPKIVATSRPRKSCIAIAETSGPREPSVPPKATDINPL